MEKVFELEAVEIIKTSGLELTKGEQLLNMFTPYFRKMSEVEQKINSLNVDMPTAIDVKIAKEIRMALKSNRVASEKTKKELKAGILIEGRLIDNLYNIIDNTSKPLESKCEQIEKFAEIQEKKRKEALKIEREELLKPFEVDTTCYLLAEMTDESFSQLLTNSANAYNAKIEAKKKAEEERIAKEKAEFEERERIKSENERLRKEAEEREKQAIIEREKQAKILAEQKAKADQERKELQAKLDQERKLAEANARKEAEEKEKLQAELRAKEDAEKKRKAEEIAIIEERIRTEKLLKKAPDKTRLKNTVDLLTLSFDITNLQPDSINIANDIIAKFNSFKRWANNQIETL